MKHNYHIITPIFKIKSLINIIRLFFTNNTTMMVLATFLAISGASISIYKNDFHWLSRFGALIGCVGIILIARPAIIGQGLLIPILSQDTGEFFNSSRHYEKKNEPIPDSVKEDEKSRKAVGWLGPLLCFIGALINAFGDMISIT